MTRIDGGPPADSPQPHHARAAAVPLPGLNLVTPAVPSSATVTHLDRILTTLPSLVQVRTKDATDRERLAFARLVVERCHHHHSPCLVNDRVDIALAAGADGVHLGDDDLPVRDARRLLGPDATIGATCRTVGDAKAAEAQGADYLGVGPCYASVTKPGAVDPLGPSGLAVIAAAVDVPVIAISGVTPANGSELLDAGAHGLAVVSAVFDADDPVAAASTFHHILAARSQTAEGRSGMLKRDQR